MNSWRNRQKKKREELIKNTSKIPSKNTSNSFQTSQNLNSSQSFNSFNSFVPLMNRETIRLIGEFIPSKIEKPLIGSSSIAMNKLGEIFFLCEGGEIRYLSANNNNNNNMNIEENLT